MATLAEKIDKLVQKLDLLSDDIKRKTEDYVNLCGLLDNATAKEEDVIETKKFTKDSANFNVQGALKYLQSSDNVNITSGTGCINIRVNINANMYIDNNSTISVNESKLLDNGYCHIPSKITTDNFTIDKTTSKLTTSDGVEQPFYYNLQDGTYIIPDGRRIQLPSASSKSTTPSTQPSTQPATPSTPSTTP